MFNNSVEAVAKLVINGAVRLPTGLVINILRSVRPEGMDPAQFEEYIQFKVKELLSRHEIVALQRPGSAPDQQPDYFAVPNFSSITYDESKMRNNAIALWAIWAYGKSGSSDDFSKIMTFRNLSGFYPLDMPFQFLTTFGNVNVSESSDSMLFHAFDFACIDDQTYNVSISMCRRMWDMQKPIGPGVTDTEEKAKNDVDALYAQYRKEANGISNKAEDAYDEEADDAIEHVAILTAFPSEYPKNILNRLREAGFHHVVYRPKKSDPSWKSARWRLLR